MKVEIIFDDFKCPISDLIDKERYEIIKTEKEDTWIVKKRYEAVDRPATKNKALENIQ